MDYKALALEFMETMKQMRKHDPQKKINESTHGEHFVLFLITKHDGPVIPSDISAEMEISSARIAATLNSLEKKGLITREIDPEDRRRILVNPTEAGRVVVDEHFKMIIKTTTGMLEYLGEHDAMEFVRIMKKLALRSPEEFI